MAKKKTATNEVATETIYIVAPGRAFTSNGVIFAEGDTITAKAFESQAAFEKVIAAGGIIAKQGETKKDKDADDANNDADNGNDDSDADAGDGGENPDTDVTKGIDGGENLNLDGGEN